MNKTNAVRTFPLPKTRTGLERAVRMNTEIADAYGQSGDSRWENHHASRADACQAKLDGLDFGGCA